MTARTDAVSLAARLGRGELTAQELTQAVLDRLRASEPVLHAYLAVAEEEALAEARQADQARAAGTAPSPWAGLPVAVKDNLTTRTLPTTCGSRILEGYRPPYDATVVARMREAGLPVLGKTNLDEFAMGSSTENSAFGPTRNPLDPQRVPGGSSGGSAAAVAAGSALWALGSDTGGSVRQPAAYCGVVGLKPTYGRVSRYGLVAFASSLDQVGTLTRTVRDSAVLLGLVAGPDPMDATCSERPGEDYLGAARQGEEDPQGTLAGLRLGLPREAFQEGVDPQVAHTVREAVRAMEREGAQVVEVSLPSLPVALSAYYLVATAEASSNLARFDGVRYGRAVREGDMLATYLASRGEGLGREVKRRILLGTFALSAGYYEAYYQRAQKARFRIRQELLTALAQCHVLVTPTAPDVAFLLGERANDPLAMYAADLLTVPVSLAGFPALSVPAGRVQGLPVGMQLIGPPFSEARLLKVGSAWEALRPWPLPPLMPEDGRGEPS